ncbi:MAG: hypothetical protein EOO99_11355 [Pedobacter sp.]|nr:MAG: hypothetical protein EOO99_11355 [Pedobacter sp.]
MTDLFISYAWTSFEHREWVRLFASQLHLLGYKIKIDESVEYGSSLSGFMREVTDSKHVLLIVDENYVERANTLPNSGVGLETKWISSVYNNKPSTWLSVLFVKNSTHKLPKWLNSKNPKGFDFNSYQEKNNFPGSAQIDSVWRWIEGLSADKSNSTSWAELRKRAARLERIDVLRDPANYANPALKGNIKFYHNDNRCFTIGHGEYEFRISFSARSSTGVYVHRDSGLKAVGLIPTQENDLRFVYAFLTPSRSVEPDKGQSVVLMNADGNLCVITIEEVQYGSSSPEYVRSYVKFSYEVLFFETN